MSKVWFVTGAGSGIGAGTVRAALKAGHRVVATGRNMEKLRSAFADIARDDLLVEPLDVTTETEARRAVDAAVARFGRIDVLVNNAGYSLLGNFEEFTIEFAVEGLSLAVAQEVAPFGIKVTVVEPGFFRTALLDPSSVEWSSNHIEDYGPAGNIAATWAAYDGQQPNDPAALGEALVQIANMEHPPRVFAAGSDALDTITPVVEGRLAELRAHADLSKGAGGTFTPAGLAS